MKKFKDIIKTVKTNSPILYVIVWIHIILILISVVGLLIDDRTLLGVNVWIKPLKFAISTGIYIFTVGYLTTLYPFSKLKRNIINNIVSWTLLIEVLIIFFQGARGVQSHYNQSSLFDGLLFAAMGILIAINVLIMVVFIIETLRLKMKTEKSVQWAILFGWIIIVAGSWIGGQMIGQMAHNVGVQDGGEGLPLVNWSTVGGDLRVAHFFGIHGLQIIPIFAYGLTKRKNISTKNQLILVSIFTLAFAFFIGFVYYQVQKGTPFISL